MELSDYPSEEINVLRDAVAQMKLIIESSVPLYISDPKYSKLVSLDVWETRLREAAKEAHERETSLPY